MKTENSLEYIDLLHKQIETLLVDKWNKSLPKMSYIFQHEENRKDFGDYHCKFCLFELKPGESLIKLGKSYLINSILGFSYIQ